MAKSQKKRDIPAGATAVATNRVARRDFDILDEIEYANIIRATGFNTIRKAGAASVKIKKKTYPT